MRTRGGILRTLLPATTVAQPDYHPSQKHGAVVIKAPR